MKTLMYFLLILFLALVIYLNAFKLKEYDGQKEQRKYLRQIKNRNW